MLQPLSLYSSELKGTRQIAGSLVSVRDTGQLSSNEVSRNRYFNSLSNQALVEGTAATPKLTPLASHYLDAVDAGADDSFWQGDSGDGVELNVVRQLVQRLTSGHKVSDSFKLAWFNAQNFFDNVPPSILMSVLSDRNQLLSLFRLNSNGWEIARYYRLTDVERAAFDAAFAKVLPTSDWSPSAPIEIAAAKYKDAAGSVQADVRFRISGFLNAYNHLRTELGSNLPRLDRQLVLRAGSTAGGGSGNITDIETATVAATRLPFPHQLIVTGCPGSGKSHYVDQLIESVGCAVFRTQFHPESSFFDFVGAYKPQPVYEPIDASLQFEEGDGSPSLRGRPLIDYRFVPGPLMQGLAHAISNPAENVVVVIEEINRGNAAAILGDMLQLLDRTSDGESRYHLAATPEVRAYFAGLGHSLDVIRLPANLYLWATMNSADQGVFPLDTAFRRRWSYVYKGYTEPCLYLSGQAKIVYAGQQYEWNAFRGALNHHLVELGIHEDKLIGPYFLTEQQLVEPASILEKLFLYLWDDVLRFRQDSLFIAKSFSLVSAVWAAGNGSPLKFQLPASIVTSEGTELAASVAQPATQASSEQGTVTGEP
ncbi:AAA family ATPase [Janthinobacterium aquaticum]|uniref:AAA family ATPase n=1 Tax=Janthinobacterium sp. FT58W TaxID=2654254 RepID=UPI0012647B05|nr:AAA family ATPase [Janthinobacterium sp. FT58W]KAB8040186.1 AAA domain-containing protein [Janthinobacterium sp. FT58W]